MNTFTTDTAGAVTLPESLHPGTYYVHEASAKEPYLRGEDLEIAMSNLWDSSTIQAQPGSVLDGDTIPAMFWNAVDKRSNKVWLREKDLGIWKSWTWTQVGEAVAEIAGGLMSLGFAR